MVVAGTASAVSTCSEDARRHRTTIGVVDADAGPSTAPIGNGFWAEDLAVNEARIRHDFTYILGDNALQSQVDDEFDNGTQLDDGITVVLTKAPRYLNSVCLSFVEVHFVIMKDSNQCRTVHSKRGIPCRTST
jgi:hypothetical protein